MVGRKKMVRSTGVLLVLATIPGVAGFHGPVAPGPGRGQTFASSSDVRNSRLEAASTADSGWMLGDKVASAIVGSPIYPLLTQYAKNTMKKSAENVGVNWDSEVAEMRKGQDWDAALAELLETSSVEVPEVYKKPFHAYSDGNLCWEAAWEQHLASLAVGYRNFPDDAARGEYLLRSGYHKQVERLGVTVDKGDFLVDLGCGSGTSSRYLAEQYPSAGKVVGLDLSAHMIVTARYMDQNDEKADPRVEFKYADAAKTGLEENSASLVSLCLVVHELPGDYRREILAEAFRILRPGGSLALMDMDPSAPGYVKLRKNPMLFSILRSTEPYLEVWFSEASNINDELQEAGFNTVRTSGVTGRHMAIVAVKEGSGEHLDLRADYAQREKDDTHMQTHTAKGWVQDR